VQFRKIIDITWISSLSLIIKKGGEQMQAYCMKCRAKREMKDARSITMKNGRPATQGVCPVCGTKMFRIGKG
jgi:Zn finger protein HypA/HybF involved in hydrogenase expression